MIYYKDAYEHINKYVLNAPLHFNIYSVRLLSLDELLGVRETRCKINAGIYNNNSLKLRLTTEFKFTSSIELIVAVSRNNFSKQLRNLLEIINPLIRYKLVNAYTSGYLYNNGRMKPDILDIQFYHNIPSFETSVVVPINILKLLDLVGFKNRYILNVVYIFKTDLQNICYLTTYRRIMNLRLTTRDRTIRCSRLYNVILHSFMICLPLVFLQCDKKYSSSKVYKCVRYLT